MCSILSKLRYLLAVPILLLFTQNVFAVQASGSISIIPSDNTLETGQVFTAIVRITNTSSETGAEGSDPVPATYLAGGAVDVTLACQTAACLVELPNTLEFQAQGGNGCVSSNAGVSSCAASGDNHVIISIGSNIVIPAGSFLNIATIQLMAENAVLVPQSGAFSSRAESGDNDLEANSVVNNQLPPATGGAQGSTGYLFPGVCAIEVDKQISCDGGTTWVDQGSVTGNEDGTNGCSTADPNPVMVRYRARNVGDFDVSGCTLSDSSTAFGTTPVQTGLAAGGFGPFLPGQTAPQCQTALPQEPDTVTFSCSQCGDGSRPAPDPASDTATLDCQPVSLLTDRAVDCGTGPADQTLVEANEDGTNGCTATDGEQVSWSYQAQNTSPVTLYDCTLVDANAGVSPNPIVVGDLAPGQLVSNIPATNQILCSDNLESAEAPDGGRVDLACCTVNVSGIDNCDDGQRVQVFDVSTVTCNTPDLNITKVCEDVDGDRIDEITISVTNPGEVPLNNCVPTDTAYLDDPTCPPSGAGTGVPVLPDPFNVGVGGTQNVTGSIGPLDADACNTASVTCNIGDTQDTITRTDSTVCPGEPEREGCLTRTPGFWGTHPHIAALYLDVSVCGTTLNNTNSGNGNSTTEAMCSVGKDGKIQGSQQTQLIRQCTAAALNIASSQELGGSCESDFPQLGALFDECCGAESICTGDTVPDRDVGSCITALDFFNNTPNDTLNFGFNTGPANSKPCRESKNNGTVVYPTP